MDGMIYIIDIMRDIIERYDESRSNLIYIKEFKNISGYIDIIESIINTDDRIANISGDNKKYRDIMNSSINNMKKLYNIIFNMLKKRGSKVKDVIDKIREIDILCDLILDIYKRIISNNMSNSTD